MVVDRILGECGELSAECVVDGAWASIKCGVMIASLLIDQLKNPKLWHFNFRGPDVERLVAGRERILLDRFYNELSANPARIVWSAMRLRRFIPSVSQLQPPDLVSGGQPFQEQTPEQA